MKNSNKNLTVAETAYTLGLHPFTVYQHVWSSSITAEKHGRRVLIPLTSVEFETGRRRQKAGGGRSNITRTRIQVHPALTCGSRILNGDRSI